MTRTRLERLSEYQSTPTDVAALQRVLLVGLDYAARREQFMGNYTVAGLSSAWPSVQGGETVDLARVTVHIRSAVIAFMVESGGSPTASNGSRYSTDNYRIKHNAGSTVWAGAGRTVNNDVLPGDYVFLTNNSVQLYTTVASVEYNPSTLASVLVLDNALPVALQSGYFYVTIGQLADVTVPAANLTLTSGTVSINSGLTVATLRTGTAKPVIAGQTYQSVALSKAYVDYRAKRTSSPAMAGIATITTVTDVAAKFIGYTYPESELGFAVYKSLPPTTQLAQTPAILAYAPSVYDASGFTSAFTAIQTNTSYSAICPLSSDSAVITAVRNLIAARASNGARLQTQAFICPTVSGSTPSAVVASFQAATNYNDVNTVAIFPPSLQYSDIPVADYVSAGIVACLRSITAPGLSLVGTLFADLGLVRADSAKAYDDIFNTTPPSAIYVGDASGPVILYSRTTAASSRITLEEAMPALRNTVRRYLFKSVEDLINVRRVDQALFSTISTRIANALTVLISATYAESGSPVVSYTIGTIARNGVVATIVDVPITIGISAFWFRGTIDIPLSLDVS